MRCWAATVSEDRFAGERLYAFATLTLPEANPTDGDKADAQQANGERADGERADGERVGDAVALIVAGRAPRLFGLGRVREPRAAGSDLVVSYTHRQFDQPIPVGDLLPGTSRRGLTELDPDLYASLANRASAGGSAGRASAGRGEATEWFVSVALPIEATSRAEAVREFWTHVAKLGPRELPAYVWPQGDELAMQAFVLGEEANLDPEED
jgi:hypothetical protein